MRTPPTWLAVNKDDAGYTVSATVTLQDPIEIGGKEVPALTMRMPLVRDQLVASAKHDPLEEEATLFCNLCEVSEDELGELGIADYGRLQTAYTTLTADAKSNAKSEWAKPIGGVVEITLPVPLKGTDKLSMSKPKVKHRLAAGRHSNKVAEQEVFLFTKITDLTPAEVESVPVVTYQRMQAVLRDFFTS